MLRILPLFLAVLLVIAACGNDDDDPTATPEATQPAAATATSSSGSSTTPTTGDSTARVAVDQAADQIITALMEHDRDRLRDGTGDHLQSQDRQHDFDRMMECVPDGASMTMVDRDVTIEDNTATVVHTFEITTADGETTTVERTMIFELDDDGRWILSEFPECPFDQ